MLWIEPDDLLHTGDIDLTSFGPYYGDAWSDLGEFETSIERLRTLTPQAWLTFHHVGVIESRDTFDQRLAKFASRIPEREARLVEYLAEGPHTLADIIEHRFVFRPQDEVLYADAVEGRSMGMHLDRLVASGRVIECEPGRFVTGSKR